MSSSDVHLYYYDLSGGLAKALFKMFMNKDVEGIWHTGVVVRGYEYWFSAGIQKSHAGQTPFGAPLKVVKLGQTDVPDDLIEEMLLDMREKYNVTTYDLLKNNCNNFSNDLSLCLCGNQIPQDILDMPRDVLSSLMSPQMQQSPLGPLVTPIVTMLQSRLGNMHGEKDFGGPGSGGAAATHAAAAAAAGGGAGHQPLGHGGDGSKGVDRDL